MEKKLLPFIKGFHMKKLPVEMFNPENDKYYLTLQIDFGPVKKGEIGTLETWIHNMLHTYD